MAYDYETLSASDLLRLARERFNALELDHARVSLTNEPARDERLADFENQIKKVKSRIAELMPQAEKETRTSASVPPPEVPSPPVKEEDDEEPSEEQ